MRQGGLVPATIPTISRFRQVHRRPRVNLMTDPKSMAAWGQRIYARQEVRLR